MTRADSLLLQFCAGNASAGAALVREYEPLCRKVAHRWRRSWLDIEDLRQEARCAVWRAIAPNASTPFDPSRQNGNLTLWLTAAINTALHNYIRKEKRRHDGLVHLDDLLHESDGLTLSDLVTSDVQTHRDCESEIELAEMFAHLDELPEKQRRVLALRYIDGLTFREAAKVLGRSHQDVANWEKRGLEMLRRKVG